MTGPIGLHGGGEFLAGDERFLAALMAAARKASRDRHGGSDGDGAAEEAIRIVVVPVAAAGTRPDLAAANGLAAFERVGRQLGLPVDAEAAMVVDRASAEDPAMIERLRGADLVYLPGGDPGLLPGVLGGTSAWTSIMAAHAAGAVICGASAGAMGLATRTWTSEGWRDGLGLVAGLVVVPHFGQFDGRGWEETVEVLRRAGIGHLGLDERTGVLSADGADGASDGRGWRVVGEGRAHWFPAAGPPESAGDGDHLALPT